MTSANFLVHIKFIPFIKKKDINFKLTFSLSCHMKVFHVTNSHKERELNTERISRQAINTITNNNHYQGGIMGLLWEGGGLGPALVLLLEAVPSSCSCESTATWRACGVSHSLGMAFSTNGMHELMYASLFTQLGGSFPHRI